LCRGEGSSDGDDKDWQGRPRTHVFIDNPFGHHRRPFQFGLSLWPGQAGASAGPAEARARAVVEALAPYGYRFFHYAPKGDSFLRRRWAEPHPLQEAGQISQFVAFCQGFGVRVGIGLSPYEAFNDFNGNVANTFVNRVEDLASLGIQDLGIFFDDMHSTLPDLAQRQIEIMHLARDTFSD
jgi:hypothetical protein